MTSSLIRFLWKLTTSRPRVYLSDIPNFILIKYKKAKIQSKGVNRELRRKKMDIKSLWPWPLTQGHQFQLGLSQCSKQPFSENHVRIRSSVRLEFCSQENIRHTHKHTDKLKWKYNPSTISWRCNYQINITVVAKLNFDQLVFSW